MRFVPGLPLLQVSVMPLPVQADLSYKGPHWNPSSEFSQSMKGVTFVSVLVEFVRGSLKCVRGQNDHVQIVLPGVSCQY